MSDATQTFEEMLERIDLIVKQLENTTIPLDQAVLLYEEGKRLSIRCETLLKAAQERMDKAMGKDEEEPPF